MTISSIPSMYTFFKSDIYVGGADFKREKATLDNAVFNNFLYSSFRRSISSSTSWNGTPFAFVRIMRPNCSFFIRDRRSLNSSRSARGIFEDTPIRVFPWVKTAYLPVKLKWEVTVGAFVFTASRLICTTSSSPIQSGFFPDLWVKYAFSASFKSK